jgi:hypothetical protein
MIKKLDITGSSNYTLLDSNEIAKLCQIFSIMEQFRCHVGERENLQLIITQLSRLSHMKSFSYRAGSWKTKLYGLKDHVSELDLYSFTIECENSFYHHSYSSDYDSDIDWW